MTHKTFLLQRALIEKIRVYYIVHSVYLSFVYTVSNLVQHLLHGVVYATLYLSQHSDLCWYISGVRYFQ
jgi:hypothetical protein